MIAGAATSLNELMYADGSKPSGLAPTLLLRVSTDGSELDADEDEAPPAAAAAAAAPGRAMLLAVRYNAGLCGKARGCTCGELGIAAADAETVADAVGV